MGEFEAFWNAWPKRIGKLAAMKAYEKARQIATPEEILAGVENYKQHLPAEKRFICHARTFLSQGRWMDEYQKKAQPVDWYAECGRLHNHECGLSQHVHHTRKILDAGKATT